MTDKNFVFAKALKDTLENAEYNNNDPVEYSQNFDSIYLSVSNWENIPLLTQTAIITSAATCNFLPID